MRPGPPVLCVSVHDVAPQTWARCERLLATVAEVAPVPLTLLVVPNYHRLGDALPDGYRAALEARRALGDELALHGQVHLDEAGSATTPAQWWRRRILTAGEGEFAALSQRAARHRLTLGQDWFRRQGWPLQGFVPPAWLLSEGSWQALEDDCPLLRYTTTADAFHLLHPRRSFATRCFAWSTRTPLRLALSVRWNGRPAALEGSGPVRLALHPDDAQHPAVLNQVQYLLDVLLREHAPMTKSALAELLDAAHPAPAAHHHHHHRRQRRTYTAGATSASDSSATPPPSATPASTSLG